jgi:Na+-transporting NADH:ubiquinone oxidoreductase subunit F
MIMSEQDNINIDINGGTKIISGNKDSSLLLTLTNNNIHISSTCAGKGICGLCRIKVKSENIPFSFSEDRLLNENEKNQGIRLACQFILKKDISIYMKLY